uniref:SCP domain-containing protein n=1 Tax=Megaselia scalaris TaxID=36166 RepID=T1H553_MEGSC
NISESCSKDAKFFTLRSFKEFIVIAHNRHRNSLAGGSIPNHKSASRMGTVSWDDDLSYLSSLNVKRCKFGLDQCRNTEKFRASGQNIAKTLWDTRGSAISNLQTQIDKWFNEYKFSNM